MMGNDAGGVTSAAWDTLLAAPILKYIWPQIAECQLQLA